MIAMILGLVEAFAIFCAIIIVIAIIGRMINKDR
jgi:low affinity Fe/Cu permease